MHSSPSGTLTRITRAAALQVLCSRPYTHRQCQRYWASSGCVHSRNLTTNRTTTWWLSLLGAWEAHGTQGVKYIHQCRSQRAGMLWTFDETRSWERRRLLDPTWLWSSWHWELAYPWTHQQGLSPSHLSYHWSRPAGSSSSHCRPLDSRRTSSCTRSIHGRLRTNLARLPRRARSSCICTWESASQEHLDHCCDRITPDAESFGCLRLSLVRVCVSRRHAGKSWSFWWMLHDLDRPVHGSHALSETWTNARRYKDSSIHLVDAASAPPRSYSLLGQLLHRHSLSSLCKVFSDI